MANKNKRLPDNVEGEFFVDSTCINCDTCRWMAPDIFTFHNRHSVVKHQPETAEERMEAIRALLSCPVAAIGTEAPAKDIPEAQKTLPYQIAENIYYTGYHSRKSFGAASYLLIHPEGNILIDSPRFSKPLLEQIKTLGGARCIFLTHIDDVADHQEWADALGAERIMHANDMRNLPIEKVISGESAVELYGDVKIIPVPGHTKGSMVLLHNGNLFTGDHLAWSEHEQRLIAWRNYCWYDWEQTTQSMEKLLRYEISAIFPGHGRRVAFDSDKMREEIARCVEWMKE